MWECHPSDQASSRDDLGETYASQSGLVMNERAFDGHPDYGVRNTTEIDRVSDRGEYFGLQDASAPSISRCSPNEDFFGEFINWSEIPSEIHGEIQGVTAHQKGSNDGNRPDTPLRAINNSSSKRKFSGNTDVTCRNLRRKSTPWPGYSENSLFEQIDRERMRRQNLHITYVDPVWNLSSHANYQLPLETFYFALGSSESVCSLQEMLACQRKTRTGIIRSASGLSKYERLQLIEHLDERISYLGFLRRCHIHQLVLDCCGGDRLALDGFIPHTFTVTRKDNKMKKGNPLKIADSQLTISMLENLWPTLRMEDSLYKKKYDLVTGLRQLGQRLAHLVDLFGFGILGLIPSSLGFPCTDATLIIDDKM